MTEIPKAYEPQSVEDKWYDFWLKQGCFTADPARVSEKRPAYSIVIPPPNVTGVLHMGHVLNNTIQDILSRKARMDGKEVLWLPGTDHAGIATEGMVAKQLRKEEKKAKQDIGREEFIKRVWTWKEKHGGIIIAQLKKLGCSCDWTRERFTMDPDYVRNVQRVFVDLYKKGLIYRGKRMVNWCPATQTALSDEEVEMKPQKGFMYHFKVQVVDPGSAGVPPAGSQAARQHAGETPALPGPDGKIWLTIATTRPETIPGDTAVAVNPKDARYAHLIGKHIVRPLPAELPREQKLIPIIGDEHVDFEFGTGVLKVTPAHDKADFAIGARHKLPLIDIMNPDATMNPLAGGALAGLDRFKARKVAVELLQEQGVLIEEKPYENNVGFSQRADVPIEPRLSEQWFLKYPAVEQSKACVEQTSIMEKAAVVVTATGRELAGATIKELRRSALAYARAHGFLGQPFKNRDSGIELRVGRQGLSHAFSNLGVANIKAVAVLPELIQKAVWISTEPHEPRNPQVKQVHRFVAALSLGGGLHSVVITAREFFDGTVHYDHKAKKIASGGKSLEAHPREGKLDTQPAPNAEVKVRDLLADVNRLDHRMKFHPDRWAKVYDHWLTNIQDWCISRQLWWGHRVPVWTLKFSAEAAKASTAPQIRCVLDKAVPCDFAIERMAGRDGEESVVRVHRNSETGEVTLMAATDSPVEADVLDKLGFAQDPDVLDTWFSSWLWPFATMGWPEQTPTLKAFYPTTDLVTAPEIIFFWVARMIMAGYEYMGDLPFRNVYFTGIVRDKQGRKMSKSLGNSPDPLDLIAKYGADAIRFGTMRSAPLGQDVMFDEKDVELGRNFCNKLWNACRFRQMVGSADSPTEGEINPTLLTSDDKWILLRLDQAIYEVSNALSSYNFSNAVQTLYRFFWNEYCDWYVEASKAAFGRVVPETPPSPLGGERAGVRGGNDRDVAVMQSTPPHPDPLPPVGRGGEGTARIATPGSENLRANKLAVIDFVLGHTLRLFHPFLPFITEELWHGMGFSKDLPENQGGKTIMFAPWPKPFSAEEKAHFGLDDAADKIAAAKYELVGLGRNLRRELKLDPAKKLKFVLKPAGELAAAEIEVLKLLLNAEAVEVVAKAWTPDKGTPGAGNALGELYLPTTGLIDFAAERVRLEKEAEKISGEIEKVRQKLANPNFTQKVPTSVLEDHKQRLADWELKVKQVRASLDALA